MAVEYVSNMGDVDLRVNLMPMYRILQRSIKSYMHMVFYCIGVAVLNGWLLYQRHKTHKKVRAKNHVFVIVSVRNCCKPP